jgi:hypothetical protein
MRQVDEDRPTAPLSRSGVPELLTLLHFGPLKVDSVSLEFNEWMIRRPKINVNSNRSKGTLSWDGRPGLPAKIEQTRRIWMSRENIRVEVRVGERLVRVAVRNLANWAARNLAEDPEGARAKVRPGMLDPPVLKPLAVIAGLEVEPVVATGIRAGRRVVCVRAQPRHRAERTDGYRYDFEFDALNGLMLRAATSDRFGAVTECVAANVSLGVDLQPHLFDPRLLEARGLFGDSSPDASQEFAEA